MDPYSNGAKTRTLGEEITPRMLQEQSREFYSLLRLIALFFAVALLLISSLGWWTLVPMGLAVFTVELTLQRVQGRPKSRKKKHQG